MAFHWTNFGDSWTFVSSSLKDDPILKRAVGDFLPMSEKDKS